jgi:hypothetical protein
MLGVLLKFIVDVASNIVSIVYTKEKRNKLSTAWLGFDGDRLYLN